MAGGAAIDKKGADGSIAPALVASRAARRREKGTRTCPGLAKGSGRRPWLPPQLCVASLFHKATGGPSGRLGRRDGHGPMSQETCQRQGRISGGVP